MLYERNRTIANTVVWIVVTGVEVAIASSGGIASSYSK